ncbi:hypothetical protein [Streptomyces sp. NEAU-W12]|uniref:hypothetical protein n=1 Tax=Streptomyces sp. NEAU-W12 TaxID=2994668 RepID=UPI00224AEE0C|nr:hypothetical protein [Streptomyces sp. NEAU-W12]MCX2926667.1 hypothetical protein [Streptomyces sp. NEAU-W12]
MTVRQNDTGDNSAAADAHDDFTSLLEASSLGAPHVRTEAPPLSADVSRRPSHAAGSGLMERLEQLGTATARYVWAAAVMGASHSAELVAAIAALGAEEAAEAAETLRGARVLTESDEPGGGLEFVHPLIATTIYRTIPPALRIAMHFRASEVVYAAGLGATAAARHLLEVPGEGDPEVVARLREAAREHLRAGAPETARRVLCRALQEPPLPEDRAALLHELAGATSLIHPTATVSSLREAPAHTDQVAEAATVTAQVHRTEA